MYSSTIPAVPSLQGMAAGVRASTTSATILLPSPKPTGQSTQSKCTRCRQAQRHHPHIQPALPQCRHRQAQTRSTWVWELQRPIFHLQLILARYLRSYRRRPPQLRLLRQRRSSVLTIMVLGGKTTTTRYTSSNAARIGPVGAAICQRCNPPPVLKLALNTATLFLVA